MSQQVCFFYCAHAKKTIPSNFVLTRHVKRRKRRWGHVLIFLFFAQFLHAPQKLKGVQKLENISLGLSNYPPFHKTIKVLKIAQCLFQLLQSRLINSFELCVFIPLGLASVSSICFTACSISRVQKSNDDTNRIWNEPFLP